MSLIDELNIVFAVDFGRKSRNLEKVVLVGCVIKLLDDFYIVNGYCSGFGDSIDVAHDK